MIDEKEVRTFWRRLNHRPYGLTELVALDRDTGRMVATGFFNQEDAFVAACRVYNGRCNMYASRNPRPGDITRGFRNYMNSVRKQRASDRDIQHLPAISLDIDPVRVKGTPATKCQRQAAIGFALNLQWELGGYVDDSGNGSYLWIPFITPVAITAENGDAIKKKCGVWQAGLVQKYRPTRYGVRVDGCYDFSRIKRVIGTYNHKAGRVSRCVRPSECDDTIRSKILAVDVASRPSRPPIALALPSPVDLPLSFKRMLKENRIVKKLWENSDPRNDTSRHDWMLGLSCVEAGITTPSELAAILMYNPHGKYRRDRRRDYVRTTVGRLIEEGGVAFHCNRTNSSTQNRPG